MSVTDVIAISALVTSVISLTYTIIVDRRRPKLQVWGGINLMFENVGDRRRHTGSYFAIRATNLGPGRVNVLGVGLTHRSRAKRWWRRVIRRDQTQGALVDALPESPNQLPMWLDVGQQLIVLYPKDSEFLEESDTYDCFYLFDSLGGNHWAPKGVFKSARESNRD